jgi:hypothetical protein
MKKWKKSLFSQISEIRTWILAPHTNEKLYTTFSESYQIFFVIMSNYERSGSFHTNFALPIPAKFLPLASLLFR